MAWTPIGRSTGVPARAHRAREPARSRALDDSLPDMYPILTGAQLGETPEERQETLETLHNARTKEGLPRKMRVWAVRQLGELVVLDPDLGLPELLLAADDSDPAVVGEAARQLHRFPEIEAAKARLLALRAHADEGVRAAAGETGREGD